MVIADFSSAFYFLQNHGYFIMFILVLFEGAIAITAAAFAASLGIFNVFIVFILAVSSKMIGDTILFFIGKLLHERVINNFGKFKIKKKIIKKIEYGLKRHFGKALLIIKVIPPLPIPGLILAGAVDAKFSTFAFYSFIINLIFCIFFTCFGFYAGLAFDSFTKYSKYFELAVISSVRFFIALLLLYNKFSKKIYKRLDKMTF